MCGDAFPVQASPGIDVCGLRGEGGAELYHVTKWGGGFLPQS